MATVLFGRKSILSVRRLAQRDDQFEEIPSVAI